MFQGDPSADSEHAGTTVLTASLDQAALRGVLNRIWDLNLTLLSVSRVRRGKGGVNRRAGS